MLYPFPDAAGISHVTFFFFLPYFCPLPPQFLAQLKIMDYSLLVGIHDVDRAEQEEMEVEERAEDEECENDGMGGSLLCSYGTPPDSPGNLLSFPRFFGPGEFDPSVDVYAMKSHESK
jgi:1-phosphatidylinositol-5-phosphate 4-kinase